MAYFEQFVNESKKQEPPVRILFLFAKATDMLTEKQTSYSSGTIEAVMCVDKVPDSLGSFQQLVAEADGYSSAWNFIFASTLSGKEKEEPTESEVDQALHKMSNIFLKGEDLSSFIIWNRKEEVQIIS